jgi:ABC-type Mn2+/Zn2+ transport system ATPase subunit
MPAESRETRMGFTRVVLAGFDALGHEADVTLDLSPRTFLVGKNGAGKSAILDSIATSMHLAAGHREPAPYHEISFVAEIDTPYGHIAYEFKRSAVEPAESRGLRWEWTERCFSKAETFWDVKDGVATITRTKDAVGETTVMNLQPGVGLLSVSLPEAFPHVDLITWLTRFFKGVRHVAAGVPRGSRNRARVILERSPQTARVARQVTRVDMIAETLVNWSENAPDKLKEFEAIGSRLKLWKNIHVARLQSPRLTATASKGIVPEVREFSIVDFDDTDIGHLSDGTLRIAEILRALLQQSPVLLIEEPETSIHPGLLRRLLSEIDTYSTDRQTIISTHSPQVVSAARPDEIRVVERLKGGTKVTMLTRSQVDHLKSYLEEEGTLGEYVFGGALDDKE